MWCGGGRGRGNGRCHCNRSLPVETALPYGTISGLTSLSPAKLEERRLSSYLTSLLHPFHSHSRRLSNTLFQCCRRRRRCVALDCSRVIHIFPSSSLLLDTTYNVFSSCSFLSLFLAIFRFQSRTNSRRILHAIFPRSPSVNLKYSTLLLPRLEKRRVPNKLENHHLLQCL